MKALGGSIRVESRVDDGSKFICRVMVSKKSEPEQEEPSFRDLLPDKNLYSFDTPRLSVGGNHDTCINYDHLDIDALKLQSILIVDD